MIEDVYRIGGLLDWNLLKYLFASYLAEIETNECLENNGGCWQDKAANITACKVRCCLWIH